MNDKAPTPFDVTIDQGGECLLAIAKLERRGRLTAPAFRAHALVNAGIDETRLKQIREQLENSIAADELKIFVRRISKVLAEPTVPCPPDEAKALKFFHGYASQTAEGLLGQLNLRVIDLVALAAYRATEVAQAFGEIDNWERHTKRLAELHKRLGELIETASKNWDRADIEIDHAGLSNSERAAGHSVVKFRRAGDLNPQMPGVWLQLMQRHADALITEAETLDEDDPAPEDDVDDERLTVGVKYQKRQRRRLKGATSVGKVH